MLTPFTKATIVDPIAFKADIVAGRKRGYFLTRGETISDVMGISTPHIISGEPYAIGVASPASRLELQFDAHLDALREAGRKIERADQTDENSRS